MPDWGNDDPIIVPARSKKTGSSDWGAGDPIVTPAKSAPKQTGFMGGLQSVVESLSPGAIVGNMAGEAAGDTRTRGEKTFEENAARVGMTPGEYKRAAKSIGVPAVESNYAESMRQKQFKESGKLPSFGSVIGAALTNQDAADVPSFGSAFTRKALDYNAPGATDILANTPGAPAFAGRLALSSIEPENIALMAAAGGIGRAIPVAGRLISGGFAGMSALEAKNRAEQGDLGGALSAGLVTALAGSHAASGGLKGRAKVPEEPVAPAPTELPLGASVAERLATPEPIKETPNAKEVVEPVGTKDVVSGGGRKVKANVKPVQPTADASPVVAEANPTKTSPKVSPTKAKEAVSPAETKAEPDVLGVKNFKTAKGSTYVVNEDGTTTRNKMARPEHPGDSGPQPKSEATWYVSPEDANKLGEFQTSGEKRTIEPVPSNPDYIGVKYTEGPNAGKFERRTVVKVSREPSVGSIPVESWKNGERVHFGNEIVEVGSVEPPQATSARKAMMSEDRTALGLDELPPAEKKPWTQALDNAKKNGLDEPDKAQALVRDVLNKPTALNDEQTAGLVLRAAKLKNMHSDLLKGIASEADPEVLSSKREAMKVIEEEFNKTSDALKQSGTEKGRNLAAQKLTINQDYDLLSVKARAKAERGGPISEKRAAAYEAVVAERDALQAKLDLAEQRSLSRQMRTASQADPASSEFGKANKLFTKERADAARQRLQEKIGGKLSAGIDPSILKDAVEIGGFYLEGGLRSFAAWSRQMKRENPNLDEAHVKAAWNQLTNDKRLGLAKKTLTRNLKDIQDRMDNKGEAHIQPPKVEYDAEYYELKRKRDAASYKLEQMIAAEHKPHPMDYVNAVHRFSILSGVSSAAKIGLASVERVGADTVESIFGTVLGKVPGYKAISEKAPSQGGGRMKEDIAAFVKAWSAPDMWQKAKGQPSSVDKGYYEATGKHPDVREGGPILQLLELPGRVHGAIKLPAQRAAWQRGMARRAAYELRQGNDIHEPAVQIRIAEGAYADSLNAIFRGDNLIVDSWNKGMRGLESYSKGENKGKNLAGKVVQVGLRLEVPIIRIPTNLAIESTMYSPIGLARAAYEVIASKGVKNLTPTQADIIMRSSKKGLIGTAVMAAAWQLSAKGDIVVAEKDDEYEGLDHGDMRVMGLRIPNRATHHPALMAIKTTVSMQKAYEASEETGPMRTLVAAAHGVVQTGKEIPFISNLTSLGYIRDGKGLVNHAKKIGKSFIPRDAKELVPN